MFYNIIDRIEVDEMPQWQQVAIIVSQIYMMFFAYYLTELTLAKYMIVALITALLLKLPALAFKTDREFYEQRAKDEAISESEATISEAAISELSDDTIISDAEGEAAAADAEDAEAVDTEEVHTASSKTS